MRALGPDDELIADCLNIDADSVVTLLKIGTRKLEQLGTVPQIQILVASNCREREGPRPTGGHFAFG